MTAPITFSGNSLDRGGDQRNTPAWVARQMADPRAVTLLMCEGLPLLTGDATSPRLVLVANAEVTAAADERLLLGVGDTGPILATRVSPEVAARFAGAPTDLRTAASILPGPEAAMAGLAHGLFDWRAWNGYCSRCGQPTEDVSGGWRRHCPACGAEHYPRVSPVTIMLIVHGHGDDAKCLIGRQAAWPPGRMSALAGFIEPGETIEEGCAREVQEEAGLTVTTVRYHSSQPWPFPGQLMIGLVCAVSNEDARPDESELEAVAWLSRDEARAMLDGRHPVLKAPPRIAIARSLIQAWVDGFEPG